MTTTYNKTITAEYDPPSRVVFHSKPNVCVIKATDGNLVAALNDLIVRLTDISAQVAHFGTEQASKGYTPTIRQVELRNAGTNRSWIVVHLEYVYGGQGTLGVD